MKKIRFVKHYKLEPPFDNKDTIPPSMYHALSMGTVDPGIHSDIEKSIAKAIDFDDLRTYTLILSSPLRRAVETAEILMKHFNLRAQLMISENLKEISWDPSLGPGRIKRFLKDEGVLGIQSVWSRYSQLEKEFRAYSHQDILCVTHSFVIQTTYLYFAKGMRNWSEISEKDIHDSLFADYLEGFTFNMP